MYYSLSYRIFQNNKGAQVTRRAYQGTCQEWNTTIAYFTCIISCSGPSEALYGYFPIAHSSNVRPKLLKKRVQALKGSIQ